MIERTLVVIKPDGVERGLTDEIISRYEKSGLKVVKRKELVPDMGLAERHYAATDEQIVGMGNKTLASAEKAGTMDDVVKKFGTTDPEKIGKQLRKWMLDFITSGKVVAIVLEGEDAVKLTRKVTGYTDPTAADKGTIRGDLGEDSIEKANMEGRPVHNLVHASGDAEEARRELSIWFPEEVGK